jgi:prepilin-type N-terminal cleavage/methylation domain-containing protein
MKGNRGITLTELIVVILLLSIVIALGYQTLNHIQSSSKRTEQQWVEQDAVVNTVEVIESRIKSSTIVSLYTNLPETEMISGFGYFFNSVFTLCLEYPADILLKRTDNKEDLYN